MPQAGDNSEKKQQTSKQGNQKKKAKMTKTKNKWASPVPNTFKTVFDITPIYTSYKH